MKEITFDLLRTNNALGVEIKDDQYLLFEDAELLWDIENPFNGKSYFYFTIDELPEYYLTVSDELINVYELHSVDYIGRKLYFRPMKKMEISIANEKINKYLKGDKNIGNDIICKFLKEYIEYFSSEE